MNIYGLLEGPVPFVFQAAILASALLLLAGRSVHKRVAAADGALLPDEGITIRNVFEVMVEFLADLGQSTIGDDYRRYFPVVGTLFFFILIANLMGAVPGVGGATSDVNTACAWAIISFLTYNYVGIRQHGWKYIYQFMGPALWQPEIAGKHWHVRLMAPFFIPLELLLHGARIVTLTVRLVANMFADHTVVTVWLSLIPIALPAIFMGLGLFVAFLQAFVFALLTMIYIGSALQEAH